MNFMLDQLVINGSRLFCASSMNVGTKAFVVAVVAVVVVVVVLDSELFFPSFSIFVREKGV